IDDLEFEGCWHGVTVRSPVARGTIRKIEFLPGVPWDEITVVSAADLAPDRNVVALIVDDQPYLAREQVNHVGEPVLLLAHPDRYVVERARSLVRLEIDELPSVHDIETALAAKTVV